MKFPTILASSVSVVGLRLTYLESIFVVRTKKQPWSSSLHRPLVPHTYVELWSRCRLCGNPSLFCFLHGTKISNKETQGWSPAPGGYAVVLYLLKAGVSNKKTQGWSLAPVGQPAVLFVVFILLKAEFSNNEAQGRSFAPKRHKVRCMRHLFFLFLSVGVLINRNQCIT